MKQEWKEFCEVTGFSFGWQNLVFGLVVVFAFLAVCGLSELISDILSNL